MRDDSPLAHQMPQLLRVYAMTRNKVCPVPLLRGEIAPSPSLSLPRRQSPEHLRPDYAGRFRCIASACEDTCCQGWSVPIDQATYERYRSTETLQPHLGTLIVLNTGSPTAADYARIPLTVTSTCPFLSPEHLCGIQQEFGSEALSVTCATYPRGISTVATNQREEALNLSCPEAARITLLEPNLIEPSLMEPVAPMSNPDLRPGEPRLAIRDFVLSLIANRTYPLWQRMYLLGFFARRLDTLSDAYTVANWADANPATVAHLLAASARIATRQRLRPFMDDLQPQRAQQLQLVMELLRTRLSQPPVPPRFLECVADFEDGLRCNTAVCEQDILTAYADAYRLFYKPFMDRHPHILENYLTNSIFKSYLPSTHPPEQDPDLQQDHPGAALEHLVLCVHMALIQTLLIGMAGLHRETFGSTHVVKLVQSFARTFEHSKAAQTQIKSFVRTHGLNRVGGVALLLEV